MEDGKELEIPPNTNVYCNSVALHTHPDYWGSNSLSWVPGRWFKASSLAPPSQENANEITEEMLQPIRGSYIPWSDGPRVCPGKKFSQVEFVAVLAKLFRTHKVEVVPTQQETPHQARKRVLAVVNDSRIILSLQMRNARSVRLRWVKRK
jgi:cytochrome P450